MGPYSIGLMWNTVKLSACAGSTAVVTLEKITVTAVIAATHFEINRSVILIVVVVAGK
jgi:hypothetical protein